MDQPAKPISIFPKAPVMTTVTTTARATATTGARTGAKAIGSGLVTLLAALASSPAFAQDDQVVRDREPDAADVARTPLTDLNLRSDKIPEVLMLAMIDPYVSADLATCIAIGTEIANLDRVLGMDYDMPLDKDDDDNIDEGNVAQGIVGSFIPFRGIVREVTGAAEKERLMNAAIMAGMVRRGYLKGLGEERGCAYPSRPVEEKYRRTVNLDD